MSKRLYKVTLTGWVIKEDNDSEVMEWTKEAVLASMVGEQLVATFIDSNESTVTPKKDNEVKPTPNEQAVINNPPPTDPAKEGREAAKDEENSTQAPEFTLDPYGGGTDNDEPEEDLSL